MIAVGCIFSFYQLSFRHMGIDTLPSGGSNFRLAHGAGNFAAKLRNAARAGDLRNVQDNVDHVIAALKPYEQVIRHRGGLSRFQERAVLKTIKKADRSLTKGDIQDIKSVVSRLRKGAAAATPDGTAKPRSGFFGSLFGSVKKEKPKVVPRYLRAQRDESDLRTGVSISQYKSGISKVSVDTSAQGGRQQHSINPLTGQPTSGGIGQAGPAAGSSDRGGQPPMPLAR